jgi:hypothetical protein
MELMMENDKTADLISKPLNVINIGLEGFATDLNVDWSPPAGGDPKIADLLSKLGT